MRSNATQIASPAFPNSAQSALPPPGNRLSKVVEGNRQTSRSIEILPGQPSSGSSPAARDSQKPLPCPAYTSLIAAKDIPDNLKESSIYNQASLEKAWTKVVTRLQEGFVSQQDVYQTIESGVLQTPTGKVLAPLFVEAIMHSIRPLGDLDPEQLHTFVKIICLFPPAKWADSFGEDVNFPRGKGKAIHGMIQDQLTAARAERDQKIASGELLDDETWKLLNAFTVEAREYIFDSSMGGVEGTLGKLEDLIEVRPSTKEAKALLDDILKPPSNNTSEPEGFYALFLANTQALKDRLTEFETNNKPPKESWLETGLNTLQKAGNYVALTAHDFAFGVTEPDATERVQGKSLLLSVMQDIELRSSFYNDVVTTGPRPGSSVAEKLVYAAHVASVFQPEKVIPAVASAVSAAVRLATPAPPPRLGITMFTPPPLPADVQGILAEQEEQLVGLHGLVKELQSSINSQAGTRSSQTTSHDPDPTRSSASATLFEMLDQLAQSVS